MLQLPLNTLSFDLSWFLSLSGAAATLKAKPVTTVFRPGSTARATISASLITWTEIGGGFYRMVIADDGTIFGSTGDYISKAAGEVVFSVDAVGSSYDAANRYVQILTALPDTLLTEPAAGQPPASISFVDMCRYIYFEMVKRVKTYDGATEVIKMASGVQAYARPVTSNTTTTTRGAPVA